MIKSIFYASALALYAASATTASASNLLELGGAKKEETILAIGSAPVKKIKPLDLGELRTGDAQLPGGLLSRSERMSLRARLALKRQEEVSRASRAREERNQQFEQARSSASSDQSPPPPDTEVVYGDNNQPVLQ